MTVGISWLDFSSEERRQAMEVIKLFEERTTVDDLGIGVVRDAISDLLFPGTSVLHTRARYFLFIPWLYKIREDSWTPSSEIVRKARKDEIKLIESLLASDDNLGTIGKVARERLKFLPSGIYWNGLEQWGIRRFHGSQDSYHRSLDRWYDLYENEIEDDDRQTINGAGYNWDPALPEAPQGFPAEPISFTLKREEAEYLRERLLSSCPGTLLTYLVDQCKPAKATDFVWEHPNLGSFPEQNHTEVEHARLFSEAIHGAALIYNLMLAEALPRDSEGWVEDYQQELADWSERIVTGFGSFKAWDRDGFWRLVTSVNPRIPVPTRTFIDRLLDLFMEGKPAALIGSKPVRRLVTERERFMKGKLARLQNREALNQWNGATGSGAYRLTYRWRVTIQPIVRDIQKGLARHA